MTAPNNDADRLLQFNRDLIAQARQLIAAYVARQPATYAAVIGPQLRHVIEHYEALATARHSGVIDYDSRQRDGRLERDPAAARARLQHVAAQLAAWSGSALQQPLRLRARAGLAGEFTTETQSSIGRELLFLASHTVHHFALLIAHCRSAGVSVPADFGKAPATIAHERAVQAGAQQAHPTTSIEENLQ